MDSDKNLDKNTVILITGTRTGIGSHLARHYIEKGLKVIGCSRGLVDYESKNYRHFTVDVSDETAVKKMFAEIKKDYSRLNVLINNAGLNFTNHAILTPLATVEKIFKTNFFGTFICCREAAKLMQKNHYGRIVNISTIAVTLGPIGTSVYGASKAAVEQFSKVFAKEVAPFGITVNTLALSFVKNGGMAEDIDKRAIKETLDYTASKSWLDPADVTRAIDSIISPKNDAPTGQRVTLE